LGFIWLSVSCIRLACLNVPQLARASRPTTAVGLILELLHTRVAAPLHHGKSGWTMRIAGSLEGPIALIIRILWHAEASGRRAWI
jgi:hypothetical protein